MDELKIINQAHAGNIQPCKNPDLAEEWAYLGFYLGFQLFHMIRPWRLQIGALTMEDKPDGSPVTALESNVESFARQVLEVFYPEAGFQGEESGAINPHREFQLIMDPIDGTRSFLSGFDTYSITLGIITGKKPIFSLIINPSTGDFSYRIAGEQSRIFQYPLLGEEINLVNLPYIKMDKDASTLVNVHPSKAAFPYLKRLHTLWKKKELALLKSVSGSPSLLILETARGGAIYFNTWFEGKTMPHDLIAPMDILQGANGQMLDWEGRPVDPWNHRGPFIAGIYPEQQNWLIQQLKAVS